MDQQKQEQQEKEQIRLVDVPVNSQQEAFQLLIQFLQLANRRGAFGMDESHKVWECVQLFKTS
tara:strand:+ start:168 stop:356 length:189 start_codon:yes stop_codon:yes gene_type:complete